VKRILGICSLFFFAFGSMSYAANESGSVSFPSTVRVAQTTYLQERTRFAGRRVRAMLKLRFPAKDIRLQFRQPSLPAPARTKFTYIEMAAPRLSTGSP
jgi:hypothetical protein